MTRALRRARAALVRQVAQQKDGLLVFDLSQPWTKQPGIFVRTPTGIFLRTPSICKDLDVVIKRIEAARATLTIEGVTCLWATSCFPEQT